ncbi:MULTISPECIES: BglII/BstYI family type II restriction endonuclease [unclassified Curtobacterium]|uniref:BglII/BstYI family type II restriction endonuclease n=1 Tax=unclassified Curtobacterium TaxID=257496 RepID=UPI001C64EC83|nr:MULTISPECIES: BglII/BstYI family type II restriction endonuclease [unclassified Curtobacterium]
MYVTSSFRDPAVIPPDLMRRYRWIETGNAAAVLNAVATTEFHEFLYVLNNFTLHPNEWLRAGGNKGDLTDALDQQFRRMGWEETRIDFEIKGYFHTDFHQQGAGTVGRRIVEVPAVYSEGFRVDNHKGRMIVDVEWNAKDGNLDRDLAAYRSWHENGLIDGAVIITKDRLPLLRLARDLWAEYQDTLPDHLKSSRLPIDLSTSTTTSLDKADIRMQRGGAGTCPVLIVGISDATWDGTRFDPPVV